MRRILAMCRIVPVLLVLATPIASAQAPADQVKVEADEIGIMKRDQLDVIAVEATKLAEQAGIAPEQMSVSLVWADRDALVYGIRVRIVTDDAKIVDPSDERGPIVQRCSDCREGDLVTASVEGVLEAIQLYRAAKEPAPAPEPAREEPPPPTPPPSDSTPVDRPRGLGPMGKAGVAGIAVGASAVIAGGVLVAVDTTRPAADPTQLREFRPAGFVTLGVGAAVLVTGVALLVVDRTQAKRHAAVAPVLGPGFAGLVARARF